jgi:plastocyanin
MIKILNKIIPTIALTLIITSCGGGGGGGGGDTYTPPATPAATSTISLSSEKGYVGDTVTVTWSSTNATGCTASNAWTGTKGTSGSETFSLESAGAFTFDISCSGSGGSGSASASFEVFKYDKLTDDLTNKDWDAVATGIVFSYLETGNYSYNQQIIYLEDYMDRSTLGYSGVDNYSLDVNATQVNDNEYNIDFSGETSSSQHPTISLNLNFNAWNQDRIDLYEYGETEPSYSSGVATFSDASVIFFGPYNEFLQSLGIDYSTGIQLVVTTAVEDYILPIVVGDLTETSDMPTGNSSSEFDTISYYYEEDFDVPYMASVAVTGEGSIDFNHTDNTLSGSITFNNWMDLEQFLIGNGPTAQYTTISDKTVTITNGQITGSKFTADLVIDDTTSQTVEVAFETNSNGSGNVYAIDGVQRKSLTLNTGTTYTFNHSSSHPFRFSTTSDGTHAGGSEYTTGVSKSSGTTVIEVTSSTPTTLYYYCDVHSGMGSDITVNSNSNNSGVYLVGALQGAFYGPNGNEIAASYLLLDGGDDESDFIAASGFLLGE